MLCVHGQTIYTGNAVEHNAYLLFDGNRLAGLSKTRQGKEVGSFAVLTPALLDAHCHIGMHRSGEPDAEGEANEQMDTLTIVPDALDSVIMDDASFRFSIESGVLYSCVLPGSGNVIGGRSAVIRNYGKTTTDALVARAGYKIAFGFNTAVATRGWKGTRPYTRMGALAILRKKLDEVRLKVAKQRNAKGKDKINSALTIEEQVLADALAGKERLRAHAHKIDDIASLLRVVDEFGLKVTVEHAADVDDPHIFEELRKRKISVVLGPVDCLAYKVELKHKTWRNFQHALTSGVHFGLMSDHPVDLQANLLLPLRHFLRLGLTKQQALEIITRRNAEILGVERILGTLAKGKWASFVGWSGDPFDLCHHPVAVYGEGRKLYGE